MTRARRSGLLQITGLTDNPRGVKIRYKLVQSSATTLPPSPGYELEQPVPLPSGYEQGGAAPLPPAYRLTPNPAATPPVPPPAQSSFSPVIEQVLNDGVDASGQNMLLDLDISRILSEPTNVQTMGDNQLMLHWLATNGIDLVAVNQREAWTKQEADDFEKAFLTISGQRLPRGLLKGFISYGATIVPLSAGEWTAISPDALATTLNVTPAVAVQFNSARDDGSSVFGVKTREGRTGLLQIAGFTENPRGVKIRYKLVLPAQTNLPPTETSSSPDIQRPAPHTNFVTITITTNGVLTLAGEACPSNELAARIKALVAQQPTEIFIKADRSVSMSKISAVMAACKNAGAEAVTGTTLVPLTPEVQPETAFQFRWVAAEGDTRSPADMLPDATDSTGKRKFRVLRDVVMSSADVDSAGFSQYQSAQKELTVFLSPRGGDKFANATRKNIGRQLAIVWNGQVLSAPVIRSAITGRRVNVTGRFTDAEAQQLLDLLNHRGTAASAPEVAADLKARLSAAEKITAFAERDAALTVVARDSAEAGEAALARQALGKMTAFNARDKATLEAARALVKTGRRAEAVEIARTITSFSQRDAALKELAQ